MEKFDLMKYLTGDYSLTTRNGWKVVSEIKLRPRSDVYKLAAKVISPNGAVGTSTWTLEGGALAGEENSRFDLIMVRIK
jgi:hypothetical protein